MSDTKVDGAPRERLYESADDDPAKIANDKIEREWAAKQKTSARAFCDEHPDRIPCAPKDRTTSGATYAEIGANLRQADSNPLVCTRDGHGAGSGDGEPGETSISRGPEPRSERESWQEESDAIAERLRNNPVSYAGKQQDKARLAELENKLATRPNGYFYALPATTDAGRKTDVPDGWGHGTKGHDGASFYAGGTAYKHRDKDLKIEIGDASAQAGASAELQVTAGRATASRGSLTAVAEFGSAKFAEGFGRNDDGSVGYHAGAGANVAAVQVTQEFDGGASVTLGYAEGVGVGGSVGTKTAPTGDTATCVQLSALFFTVGACVPIKL